MIKNNNIFENTDKRKLYWLIDQYLLNGINSHVFANEYHNCYDVELDLNTLTKVEEKLFCELGMVAGRFSEFEKDFVNCNVFYNEKELKQAATEVQEKLKHEQANFLQTFDRTDKRKLYWLINLYLLNTINTKTFCDEFVDCYTFGVDSDLLTPNEFKAFAALNPVAANFSKLKDDFQEFLAGTSYTTDDLKNKIIQTKELLYKEKMI